MPDPPDATPETAELLPPTAVLRRRLAKAMRDVDILTGLLKLAERVARDDGLPHGTGQPFVAGSSLPR